MEGFLECGSAVEIEVRPEDGRLTWRSVQPAGFISRSEGHSWFALCHIDVKLLQLTVCYGLSNLNGEKRSDLLLDRRYCLARWPLCRSFRFVLHLKLASLLSMFNGSCCLFFILCTSLHKWGKHERMEIYTVSMKNWDPTTCFMKTGISRSSWWSRGRFSAKLLIPGRKVIS